MIHVAFVAPFLGRTTVEAVSAFVSLSGVRLGLITHQDECGLPPSIRHRLAGHVRIGDATNADHLIEGARRLARQWGGIDGIECYLEQLQVPVARVRDTLRLRGIGQEVALNFRDKNRMKTVLREAGVPVARQSLVRTDADAREFVAAVGYPIVVKPLAGQGAEQTHRVVDDASLEAALEALLPGDDRPVQAEEFIDGEEHTFEAVTIAGRTVWASSVQYLPTPLKVLENPWMQYALLMPREGLLPHAREFEQIHDRALAALGLRDGLTHMEWFRRGDGSMVVSEVAARPPGANIMKLLAAAHDADPQVELARLLAYREWRLPARRHAAGCVFLRAMGGGRTVQRVEGAADLANVLGRTLVAQQLPVPGHPRSEGYEGDGWVLVKHPDTAGVVDALRTVLQRVRIL